ncbi:MAG: acetaldehyde dehydrogenase (acetylating) [Gammaproteobacteria bacterium]|nr:acetaldehyde dehydrogenase (acetylating) [Gammaproteobacteria bacterium]
MTEPRANVGCAVLGSGNIGTDLMIKLLTMSENLDLRLLIGIEADSDGLAKARERGIATCHEGIDGARRMPEWRGVQIVFDATSASAHAHHDAVCRADGKQLVDLTPAAIGPYCVPVVNMAQHLDADNVNMVSCGGQATIPMVHAVRRVAERVPYAEIVASVASKSAGPGTRANIDEFTETTAKGIEVVGGAERGKAIIVLNPAEPPMIMRDTVYTLSIGAELDEIEASVQQMVGEVQRYVPGYRLKQKVQFERFGSNDPLKIPGMGTYEGVKSTIFLEVAGAGHYLPKYAGNLDIMTYAAMATGERIAELKFGAAA